MRRAGDTVGFIGVSLLIIIASFVLARGGTPERSSFKAFYCAGAAVEAHRDPYLVEPLRSCERRFVSIQLPPGYVEPAPVPGYALAFFAQLSRVPPTLAAEIYCVLLALATIASAACIAELSGISKTGTLIAFMPLAFLNVAYGELPPIALLAATGSAYLLAKRRFVPAGVAVSFALAQPNIGLVAVLAVFLAVPRSRLAIVATSIFLALVSVSAIGVAGNVEYFSTALPLQQISELVASDQYSSSRILYELGLAPSTCITIARIFFCIMAAFSVGLAWLAAVRTGRNALLPLIPPAVILFGGIYVHDIQMILALPAAFLVATLQRNAAYRWLATISTAILAVVWTQHPGRAVIVLTAAAAAAVVFSLSEDSARKRLLNSLAGAIVGVLAVIAAQRLQKPIAPSEFASKYFDALPGDFAATAWARYLGATPALTHTEFLSKVPTWLGLLGLIVCCAALARKRAPQQLEAAYASPLRMA